jgi:hypothetical protein
MNTQKQRLSSNTIIDFQGCQVQRLDSPRPTLMLNDGRGWIVFTMNCGVWRTRDGKKAPDKMQSIVSQAYGAASNGEVLQ